MSSKAGDALQKMAKDLGSALGDDLKNAGKAFYRKTGDNVEKISKRHRENDDNEHAAYGDMAKRRNLDHEGTPMYRLDDQGGIKRLHPDREPSDLTDDDRNRIGLGLDSLKPPKKGDKLARLPKKKGRAPRPTTTSTKVDPGSTELSRATQLAHRADDYYGKGDPPRNYAAARVQGANGGSDFILAGRSLPGRGEGPFPGDEPYSVHSERRLGVPFLREGQPHRIREMYTERAPCDSSNCAAWLGQRMPHVQVTHSFDYGAGASKAGNAEMKGYLQSLKPR